MEITLTLEDLERESFRAVRHILNSYDEFINIHPEYNADIAGAVRGIVELERGLYARMESQVDFNKN